MSFFDLDHASARRKSSATNDTCSTPPSIGQLEKRDFALATIPGATAIAVWEAAPATTTTAIKL